MEKVDDSVDYVPISRNDTDEGRNDFRDCDDTANMKNETLNDLQDSDVEMKSTAPATSSQRKKAYTCKRCGKPLKGHTCDANPISLPAYFSTPGKRRRTSKRRFNIEGEVYKQLPTTTETNDYTAQTICDVKKTIRDKEKESTVDQSRNWYDDDDDDDDDHKIERTAVDKRLTPRKRVIQLESSSDDNDHAHGANDAVISLSQTSLKRSYTCRICGVPRKGHICPFVAVGSSKRQAEQPPPKHNNINRRRSGNNLESVSVMERTEYNNGSDSNDDDEDDDDEDHVPPTEVLIPARVFFDEVHSYISEQLHQQRQAEETKQLRINTKKSMEGSLQVWATNVYTKFEKLNERVFNEMQRVIKQKQIEQSITKERDLIMVLNRQIKCIQNDSRTITDHVISLRNEHNRNIAASQFLSAIDAIRDK